MFRKLLQDAASVSGRAGGAADLQLIASADAQLANSPALQVYHNADTMHLQSLFAGNVHYPSQLMPFVVPIIQATSTSCTFKGFLS